MLPDTTIVSAIQHHHQAATAAAGVAIKHAIEAGRLLIEAKAAMPHGTFGEWVESECGIGYRMARKYMLAHKRLSALPEANWPSTANIDKALAGVAETSRRRELDWLPPLGEGASATDGRGRTWYVWRVGTEHVRYIAETIGDFGGGLIEGSKRGIRNDFAARALGLLGLPDPANAKWRPEHVEVCEIFRDALNGVYPKVEVLDA
jgi:hypothetical protein